MKKIIITLFFMPLLAFGQTNQYKFFGINLDSDWYTLTDQQALAYWIQAKDSAAIFVFTDFEYSHNKIDQKFLDLGFEELLLGFPKDLKSKLNELKPEIFIARITYKNNFDYNSRSYTDLIKTLTLCKTEFGDPVLNKVKENYSIYKWDEVYFDLILTCRLDELTTTLIYVKK